MIKITNKTKRKNPKDFKELKNLLSKNVNIHFKSNLGYAFIEGNLFQNTLGNYSIVSKDHWSGLVSFSPLKINKIINNDIYLSLDNFSSDISKDNRLHTYILSFINNIIYDKPLTTIFIGKSYNDRFSFTNKNLRFDEKRQLYILYKNNNWFVNFEFNAISKIDETADLIYLNFNL